jgi:ACS family tartrate transporter-like MFS transporter
LDRPSTFRLSPRLSPARSAVAKISWRLLPLLGLGYLVAFMDRVNISFASLQMNSDLGFSATIYGLGGGLFFLAYALFEVPSNLLLARFGARRWLARIMITWGILATAMMLVRTPMQFYALRFALGMAEAGFFPGVIYYLAHWYPKSVRGTALSRFYMTGPIAGIVMGGVSPWLLSLGGHGGLNGWQWLFLAQGLPAVVIGLLVLAFLPDSPEQATWLSDEEKAWVATGLAGDAAVLEEPTASGVLVALRHPQVWRLGLFGFLTIGAYMTFILSAPQLLKDATGLGTAQVGLITSIAGVLGAIGMLLGGAVSDRLGERFSTMLTSTTVILLGYIVMAATLDGHAAIFVAAFLVFHFAWTSVTLSCVMLWPDLLNMRLLAVGGAAINTVSQVGAFVMPFAWGVARDATGSYRFGLIGLATVTVLAVAMAINARAHAGRSRSPMVLGAQVVTG